MRALRTGRPYTVDRPGGNVSARAARPVAHGGKVRIMARDLAWSIGAGRTTVDLPVGPRVDAAAGASEVAEDDREERDDQESQEDKAAVVHVTQRTPDETSVA